MSGTINTIPASLFASVIPSVISAGGSALSMNALMLSNSPRVPVGSVLSFPTPLAISNYFGATSVEAQTAAVYYAGFTGSTQLPAALLVAQYPTAAVAAYLRGGSGLTLTQAQALSGVLTVTVNGTPTTSSAINLASATSLSNAAQIISTALALSGPAQASMTAAIGATFTGTGSGTNLTTSAVTGLISVGDTIAGTGVPGGTTIVSQSSGTPGGAGVYVTSAATTSSGAALTGSSTVLNVTAVASGTLAIGQQVQGTGITAGSYITALGTGTGGAGTYVLTQKQTVVSEAMTTIIPAVTYDSISGGFLVQSSTTGSASTITFATGTISAGLLLTSATGAVLSQGAAAGVPATNMNAILAQTQNFATFFSAFDPDLGSGNAQKLLFAQWNNSQAPRYLYIALDTDITPTQSSTATASLGYIINTTALSGTMPVYEPVGANYHTHAFVAGSIASINFSQQNGRVDLCFLSQSGLGISVTNATAMTNLIANGYVGYGNFATANQTFQLLYNGQVSGPYQWADSYVNQIWLSAALQQAEVVLLKTIKSIPYNSYGYGLIRQALLGPILAAVNFGAIRQGVTPSTTQAAYVNNLVGMAVDNILSTVGWYLYIQAASPQTRQARQSPTMILFYMDGESVQQLNLSSILMQ